MLRNCLSRFFPGRGMNEEGTRLEITGIGSQLYWRGTAILEGPKKEGVDSRLETAQPAFGQMDLDGSAEADRFLQHGRCLCSAA